VKGAAYDQGLFLLARHRQASFMFSLQFQEKLRKPILGLSGFMHRTGLASAWLRVISASQRFIVWRSPFIAALKATTVIDIGASSGEFALIARSAFPKANIVSFEPQQREFETLQKVMHGDKKFQGFQVALGAKNETAVMHVSPFSPSSSFVFKAEESEDVEMTVEMLDNYVHILEPAGVTILKMDVEGYEHCVLQGGEQFIKKCDWAYIECRTNDILGCSFAEIYEFLTTRGWVYQGAYDSEYSGQGKLMYFDAFFRNTAKS